MDSQRSQCEMHSGNKKWVAVGRSLMKRERNREDGALHLESHWLFLQYQEGKGRKLRRRGFTPLVDQGNSFPCSAVGSGSGVAQEQCY